MMEQYIKVKIELPNNEDVASEILWAEIHTENTCFIRNVPFFAYGLNYNDLVEINNSDDFPIVTRVIKKNGYKTYRVQLNKPLETPKEIEDFSTMINEYGANIEMANKYMLSINIKPNGDLWGLYDKLEELSNEDILDFETCEERIKGSFDI